MVVLGRDQIVMIQQALIREGFLNDRADGVIGDRTRDAIRRWQAKIGHPQTGQVTDIERIMLIGPQIA